MRLLTPLPDKMGDNVEPQSGQVFRSFNCCLTLIVVLGVVITILVVGAGRNLGVGIGLSVALGRSPIALRCTILAAPPPHPPHAIMSLPFSLHGVVLVLAFVRLGVACTP